MASALGCWLLFTYSPTTCPGMNPIRPREFVRVVCIFVQEVIQYFRELLFEKKECKSNISDTLGLKEEDILRKKQRYSKYFIVPVSFLFRRANILNGRPKSGLS